MALLHKDFFRLQLQFAKIISEKKDTSLSSCLFQYTPLYVRIFGFSDENPPEESNPLWITFAENLPESVDQQVDYVYDRYVRFEDSKQQSTASLLFGCFSYNFHADTNTYELHFTNVDDKSNLAKDAMQERLKELKKMFAAIKKEKKLDSPLFVRTWLLHIEAFTRLFPPEFTANAKPWEKNFAQDNSHWGQFVDRLGNVKTELAEKLLEKARSEDHENINFYFPLTALISELDLPTFYEFYKAV